MDLKKRKLGIGDEKNANLAIRTAEITSIWRLNFRQSGKSLNHMWIERAQTSMQAIKKRKFGN